MGRLVNVQQGDYGLHNATFIAKLPPHFPRLRNGIRNRKCFTNPRRANSSIM
jgi:hypothetical protein